MREGEARNEPAPPRAAKWFLTSFGTRVGIDADEARGA